MQRSILVLALLAISGCYSVSAQAPPPNVLRVGFKNLPGTPLSAFETAIVNGVCSALQAECQIIDLPSNDDRVNGLVQNQYDMTVGHFVVTPQRAQEVDFVQPYYYSAGAAAYATPAAAANIGPGGWEGLRGRKVCIEAGYYVQQDLATRYGIDFVVIPTFEGLAPAVQGGQCEAAISGSRGAAPLGLMNLQQQPAFPPVNDLPYAIAVAKGNTELATRISQALTQLLRDGAITGWERQFLLPAGVQPNPFLQTQVATAGGGMAPAPEGEVAMPQGGAVPPQGGFVPPEGGAAAVPPQGAAPPVAPVQPQPGMP